LSSSSVEGVSTGVQIRQRGDGAAAAAYGRAKLRDEHGLTFEQAMAKVDAEGKKAAS